MNSKANSKRGYTAVELLVVLALVSVVSLLGVVNYADKIPRYRLREASRKLASQLRILRQKAITEGKTTEIRFSPGEGTYFLPRSLRINPAVHLPRHVRFGVPDGVTKIDGSQYTSIEDSVTFIDDFGRFNPNGSNKKGTVYLTNAPTRNDTVAISVNFTGRVKLRKWDGNVWK